MLSNCGMPTMFTSSVLYSDTSPINNFLTNFNTFRHIIACSLAQVLLHYVRCPAIISGAETEVTVFSLKLVNKFDTYLWKYLF